MRVSTLAAAERATLILTNGERRSGEVASGEPRDLTDGQIRLMTSGEQAIPIDQVAVIDFTGGTASPTRAQSHRARAGGQTAIMRSGHAQAGKFVNIIRDDTLLWENDNGQQEQYPLRDVSRVYLNPDSARSGLQQRARGRAPAASGTTGTAAGDDRPGPRQSWRGPIPGSP